MARLRESYKNDVFPALMEQFKYTNVMEVPKLEKVTINMVSAKLRKTQDNGKRYRRDKPMMDKGTDKNGYSENQEQRKSWRRKLQGETGNALSEPSISL